jgi:hypothetical protein
VCSVLRQLVQIDNAKAARLITTCFPDEHNRIMTEARRLAGRGRKCRLASIGLELRIISRLRDRSSPVLGKMWQEWARSWR